MKIIYAVFCWLAISMSCGVAQTPKVTPVVYELNTTMFIVTVDGGVYHDPTPYTTHTLTLWGNLSHKRAAYATWRIIWSVDAPAPGAETAIIRLYTRTPDTSAPKVPVAYKLSSTMWNPGYGNVSNDGVDVTAAFNAFLDAGAYGQFGWDFAGDNTHPVKYWTVRLEVGWLDQ